MSGESAALRVSVRALVGFSIFPPDIMPVSGRLMALGRAGHLARQAASAARAESALRWRGECEGLRLEVQGRMDLFDGSAAPPVIEEIKLAAGEAPAEPGPDHLAQAACYGFMLCERDGFAAVRLRVCYVSPDGEERAAFSRTMDREELRERFFALLIPYARWQNRLAGIRAARDQSIAALPFPYLEYRPGQKEMAVQAYTAISRRRRLFAVMPTGTGKSAAVLYPAIKALGQGLCSQVFYLTARGTQRLAARKELDRMASRGLRARTLTLYAREKLCPMAEVRCHPDCCERARGHYLRQGEAVQEALQLPRWEREELLALAEAHCLCPFELSLALCEIADVVIGDYNYAFDPRVRLSRVFDSPRGVTLLVDEAHNLPGRAQDMLSGALSLARLAGARREAGRVSGRSSALYKAFSGLMRLMNRAEAEFEPEALEKACGALLEELGGSRFPGAGELARELIAFLSSLRRGQGDADYHLIWEPGPGRGRGGDQPEPRALPAGGNGAAVRLRVFLRHAFPAGSHAAAVGRGGGGRLPGPALALPRGTPAHPAIPHQHQIPGEGSEPFACGPGHRRPVFIPPRQGDRLFPLLRLPAGGGGDDRAGGAGPPPADPGAGHGGGRPGGFPGALHPG